MLLSNIERTVTTSVTKNFFMKIYPSSVGNKVSTKIFT